MKKILFSSIISLLSFNSFCQLDVSFEKDTIILERDELIGQIFRLPIKVKRINQPGVALNTINFAINPLPATTMNNSDFNLEQASVTVAEGVAEVFTQIKIDAGKNPSDNILFITVQMSYNNPTAQIKTAVIKVINKKKKETDDANNTKKGKQKDKGNYIKCEIVQYSDITGVKNDLPNGLLQFQGFLKIPLNKNKYVTGNNWSFQGFRSIVFDGLVNRVDKSKEEIDYKYTNFLYQDNIAKKTPQPWLATTDIWRYSNFQAGIRIVPLAIEKDNFRIQLQFGIKLLKNRPYSQDSILSGLDSGKVKADFRSVYSNVKFLELFIRTMNADNKFEISFNTGFMWLTLMDSYYKQIEIYQQDPFNRATSLSTISGSNKNSPMWYTSFRLGYLLGEEKIVSTFLRLNYMLQTGTYLKPLSNIIDGRPVVFEEKKFYNNFFQVHIGTTIELGELFKSKEKKETDKKNKKEDGTVANSL